jgi:hypothetical protein
MTTKIVDARGRITLGTKYANSLVFVRERDDGVLEIAPAEAVPAREAWLHKNPKALDAVREGLEDARAGRLAEVPGLKAKSRPDAAGDGR